MRTAAIAFASVVTSLTFSPAPSPVALPHASLRPLAVAGSVVKRASAGDDRTLVGHTTARAAPLGPAALRFGRSIGSPTEGRLLGGMHVDEAAYLRVVPAYSVGDVRWGLEPLVAMLDRAARAVRRQFPDAVTSVGHLSRMGGGDIDRHRSHESGRDADVSFFVRGVSGKPLLPSHFVAFRGDGSAVGWPGAFFDDARNWALVAAMVSDPEAHVTHLFVAAPLRARLLGYAERVGAPAGLRVRAAEAMQQPRGALPHDDHFHVRIGCPLHMSGCVENPATRSGPPALLAAHGRRGGVPQRTGIATPKRPAVPAGLAPTPDRGLDPLPDQGDDPSTPPASLPAPVDDVDG